MSSPKAQATAIASMLTAVFGDAPAEDESDERIRIEATVPNSLGEAARLNLLGFLSRTADRFGHHLDKDGTSRIWAEVDRDEIPGPPAQKPSGGEPDGSPPATARQGINAQADGSEGQA